MGGSMRERPNNAAPPHGVREGGLTWAKILGGAEGQRLRNRSSLVTTPAPLALGPPWRGPGHPGLDQTQPTRLP